MLRPLRKLGFVINSLIKGSHFLFSARLPLMVPARTRFIKRYRHSDSSSVLVLPCSSSVTADIRPFPCVHSLVQGLVSPQKRHPRHFPRAGLLLSVALPVACSFALTFPFMTFLRFLCLSMQCFPSILQSNTHVNWTPIPGTGHNQMSTLDVSADKLRCFTERVDITNTQKACAAP